MKNVPPVSLASVYYNEGPSRGNFEKVHPLPADIASLLDRLDGDVCDSLYIAMGDRHSEFYAIGVGGGDSRGVVVDVQVGPREIYYLRQPGRLEREDASTWIVSSGSTREVFVRWLVDRNMAARAIWFFLLTGELDPGLTWEADSDLESYPAPPDT